MSTVLTVPTNDKSAVSDDLLSRIDGYEAALAALDAAGVAYESISDYGTGFFVVDKERLVTVPFVILEWRFNESKEHYDANNMPLVFVSAAVVTEGGDKFIINDGSTGIRQQLQAITARRRENNHATPQNGLVVPHGLTVSQYLYTDASGKSSTARTYYLSEVPA